MPEASSVAPTHLPAADIDNRARWQGEPRHEFRHRAAHRLT
jgi:hypothetical protein